MADEVVGPAREEGSLAVISGLHLTTTALSPCGNMGATTLSRADDIMPHKS